MVSFLRPKDGPVIAGEEQHEIVHAKDKPQYQPLRTLHMKDAEGTVISRWSPTAEQRKAIAEGKDIFLSLYTFGGPLAPSLMFVAGDEDAAEIVGMFGPIERAHALEGGRYEVSMGAGMTGIPKQLGPEAQAAAYVLAREIEALLAEAGLPRVNSTGALRNAIGLIVQCAIDKRMKRIDA